MKSKIIQISACPFLGLILLVFLAKDNNLIANQFVSVTEFNYFNKNEKGSASSDDFFNGLTLPLHSSDYHYDYTPMIQEVSETGAEWIGIAIKFFQEDYFSSDIEIPADDSPFWQQFKDVLIVAKQNDLKIFVLPIVFLKTDDKRQWRGTINPRNKNNWYKDYAKLMSKIAQISETNQVELLAMGSELSKLQKDTEIWTALITQVRKQYTGKLTYSVNWDAMESIKFHDNLDYLGISSYFSISKINQPTVKKLYRSWMRIKRQIKKIMRKKKIPFYFSELGYRSMNGASRKPWDYRMNNKADWQEQYDCFQAFIKCWQNDKDLKGVFFYEWYGEGGKNDNTYTIKNKPALDLVKDFFTYHQ